MRARAFGRSVLLLAAAVGGAAVAGAGCDWRIFDTLQGDTPVRSIGPPGGYAAPNDFGRVMVPLAVPADDSASARFLAAATASPALVVVDLDAHGHAQGTSVPVDVLADAPVASMAEVPGAGKVLVGVTDLSTSGGGILGIVPLTPPFNVLTVVLTSTEAQFGCGVASSNLTGAAAPEYVVASGSAVHVFPDGQPSELTPATNSSACPILLSPSLPTNERINRAVAIGNLLSGGGTQIAVGTPVPAGSGSVSFFTVAAGAVSCVSGAILTAPGGESQFGQAMAIGDFDGDGAADLLVGAPPAHAYLYRGPIAPGAKPTATLTAPGGGGGAFGAAVAAFGLDAKKGDEALISDPFATVDGKTNAGQAFLFTGPALATQLEPTLADREAGAGEEFGSAVGGLPFCAAPPCAAPAMLPLVGASAKVLTYFTLGPADPRAM